MAATPDSSLNALSTLWTIVRRAGTDEEGLAARQELCRRYHRAAERFLRILVRDDHLAAELGQEFAIKVMHGKLSGAKAEQGRFRDYIKGVLRHLVTDYFRRQGRVAELQHVEDAPEPIANDQDPAQIDAEWIRSWRQELLNRTWTRLAENQVLTGQPVHDVLKFRSDHPELRSHEMAEPLGRLLGKPLKADSVRQLIHRARERFGELLLNEIAETLDDPSRNALEDELADLELLQYCQAALENWRPK